MKCPNCAYQNDEDAGFCENCGQPLSRACSNCGAELKPSAKFCKNCGTPATTQAAPSVSTHHQEEEQGVAGDAQWGEPGDVSPIFALRRSAPDNLQAKIRSEARKYEGERKPVTILFADIVGSTSLAEQLDPEEWKEVVNGAHRRITEIVYRYEGTIAQLLGDGVLAFFGAPVTHEDDPLRAVKAALEIQEAIDDYAGDLQGYIDDFQLRVGIHSGTVVVGAVGSDLHMEYLAIGDAVNLAARLQSAAEPGRVLISAATARFVRPFFDLQDLGEIQLKGIETPVQVYAVGGSRVTPGSGRGIQGLGSPFVGRQAELSQVQAALEGLRSGRGGIVFVLGEAGIGKSRLVEEARIQADDNKLHWLEGRALSYGQALPYWPITQLIRDDLDLSDADPDGKVSVALRRRTQALFGDRSNEALPYLANLLGLDLEPDLAGILHSLDSETLRHQTRLILAEYFAAMARDRPSVLILEDLHWADRSSVDTIEALLALTNQVPILILCLARIDRDHPSWALKIRAETDFPHRIAVIELRPLGEKDADALVENLLEVAQLTQEARELILQRAEGNPFYLEELIRSLIEGGALVKDGPNWRQARAITDLDVPETLQGLLLARIDRLEASLRDTLQMAAVIGRSFLYRLLSAISEAERTLEQQLAELQRLDLVREKSRLPELEYMFKHSLTQEAAYDSLLIEKRRQFHQKVGEAIEVLFPDRVDDLPGLLAHHFDLAGETDKAAQYLLQAGDQARLEDSLDEAIRHYQRAIAILEETGQEAQAGEIWLKLGLVYSTDFRFDEAYEAYEKVFAIKNPLDMQIQGVSVSAYSSSELNVAASGSGWLDDLDPGIAFDVTTSYPLLNIFEGLARIDEGLNLIPAIARSWQVLDGGSRYRIYLREDTHWTDGHPVTAADFEWSWKRNLRASDKVFPANLLDDIAGARDYRLGKLDDPDKIGVRALDDTTLEVQLEKPVAYFPYLLWLPVTFPLPSKVIEHWGTDWWKPEHIVSNGPYQLVRYEPGGGFELVRNPLYRGEFLGNVNRIKFNHQSNLNARIASFRSKQLDMTWVWKDSMEDNLQQYAPDTLNELSNVVAVFPNQPPITDTRVRQAFAYAFGDVGGRDQGSSGSGLGGILPRGLPGHSPGLGFPYNPEQARKILAEAGYPEGKGFPTLEVGIGTELDFETFKDPVEKMATLLGIEVNFQSITYPFIDQGNFHLYLVGWILDYPDPDSVMRVGAFREILRRSGWDIADYDRLVEQAASTQDRSLRMDLYRRADYILVNEHVYIVPIDNGERRPINQITQSWVKGVKNYPIGGWIPFKYLTIDEEERRKEKKG